MKSLEINYSSSISAPKIDKADYDFVNPLPFSFITIAAGGRLADQGR